MFSYCSNITERVLYSTIKDVMNSVFTGFEKEQLSASLLSGSFVIRNLNIRRELFENISFPISLSHGLVGKVNIDIIWRKIFTQEFVKIRVEDVYLIFNIIDMKKWSVEMFEKNWVNIKTNLLKQDEFMMFLKSSIASNFMRQLGNFFVSKIQIEIKNIHFRVENVNRKYMDTFVIGLSIENILSQNCNEYWIPLDGECTEDNRLIQNYSYNNRSIRVTEMNAGRNSILFDYLNKNNKNSSVRNYKKLITEFDVENVKSIVKNNFESLIYGRRLENENMKEFKYIIDEIIAESKSIYRIENKSEGKVNFWSKLRDNTPLKWVWGNINNKSVKEKVTQIEHNILTHQEIKSYNASTFNNKSDDNNHSYSNSGRNRCHHNHGYYSLNSDNQYYNSLIYPYPNKFGLIKRLIDKYIFLKETKEIYKYKKDKLVNGNVLVDKEVYLKSFKVINFSIYVDSLCGIDGGENDFSSLAWGTLINGKSNPEKITILNELSLKEAFSHSYIIHPYILELRLRLCPKILKYEENMFASALNDRFYALDQDRDNEIIPLISSYFIIDGLNLNIEYKQIRILLEFIDYSIFLYGDFETGSCPLDYHNYPDNNTKKKYRLSWFDFLIGNKDRSYHVICDIEDKYNVYSLIRLRNDVFKCINYSIYYTLRYKDIIKPESTSYLDSNTLNLPEVSIIDNDCGKDSFFDLMEFNIDPSTNQKNITNESKKGQCKSMNNISEDDKITGNIFRFILSKIVVGQNEHYFDSFNIREEIQTNQSEIVLDSNESEFISSNDLINKAIENTKILLSNEILPKYVNSFDINSHLKKETKRNHLTYHTCLFSLTFNILNLSMNYSIDYKNSASVENTSTNSPDETEIFSSRNIRLNSMDLFLQYKHFMESTKSEITIALENSFVVVDDGSKNLSSSKCLLRIGPNIQENVSLLQSDEYEYLIFHPILHRPSIYTGTSICNKRPYRTYINNGFTSSRIDTEICDHIGGFWFTIGLNSNPFRKSPRISVNGKIFGEISLVGSYEVLGNFLDPIINHLSPKQRNNYLNNASRNIIKVIKKGQQLVNEYFNDRNFDLYDIGEDDSSFSKKDVPNYIYINIEAKAKQCLFLPILKRFSKDCENQNSQGQCESDLCNTNGVYCIDFGEMEIKVGNPEDLREEVFGTKGNSAKQSKLKFCMDNIKVFISNISLSYLCNLDQSDLCVINHSFDTQDYNAEDGISRCNVTDVCKCNSRYILKPQDWIFKIVKYMTCVLPNSKNEAKQYILSLEFCLDLKENTFVEIEATDLDLHYITEIINYFMEYYSRYNIINYSEILISNNSEEIVSFDNDGFEEIYSKFSNNICEVNRSKTQSFSGIRMMGGNRDSNLSFDNFNETMVNKLNNKLDNIKFSSNIEFVSKISGVKITVNSDRKYRNMIGMVIKDLPCIRLMVNSIDFIYINGDNDSDSGIYISIGDICLSGGILNRNSYLLVPLIHPISENFCNITIKFSDLRGIDRYKNFTGILLTNSHIDVQVSSPRFTIYWELYGIILNWIITFYFKSVAIYLTKKIDIDNVKSIFVYGNPSESENRSSLSSIKTNKSSSRVSSGYSSKAVNKLQFDCPNDEYLRKEANKNENIELSKNSMIQFLSMLNLNIHFKNVMAVIPCTLSDPIQMVVTERDSYTASNASSSSSSSSASAYSHHSVPISTSGMITVNDKDNFSEGDSFIKIDILKSLLAVIESDIIYSFNSESIFEIENKKDSKSKLKYCLLKSSFEILKGNLQFGKSITPRFIFDQLNSISTNGTYLNNLNEENHRGMLRSKFIKSFCVSSASNIGNLNQADSANSSIPLSASDKSDLRRNNTIHDLARDHVREKAHDNYHDNNNWYHTNTIKSYLLSKTKKANYVIFDLENIVNSHLWGFNIDHIYINDCNIISSLRLRINYINHQFYGSGKDGDIIQESDQLKDEVDKKHEYDNCDDSTCLLYIFLESIDIKANTNDLLHLINIIDMYYNMIQNNLFVDLIASNTSYESLNLDFQDSNVDLNSENSSRYVGYNYQINSGNKDTSMSNNLLYLFPSIFYSTVTGYKKFISQFKTESIKIHYIPSNLFSNKDGVLVEVSNSQLGIFVNSESPDVNFLLNTFPFLNCINNFGLLYEEFETNDKELMIPNFSINSIPILPILPRSKNTLFGMILEFNKISVHIYNNKLMFYDNFIEPFDINILSVCKGERVNISEITKEKVIPECSVDISWINMTLTPEYVKYWLNCLDNFNEVYGIYYKKLNNTHNLISKQIFLYNEVRKSIMFKCEDDTRLNLEQAASRPTSEEYDKNIVIATNMEKNREYLSNPRVCMKNIGFESFLRSINGDCRRINDWNTNGSNFIFYNDTGQTIAILMPYFMNHNKSNNLNYSRVKSQTEKNEFYRKGSSIKTTGRKRISYLKSYRESIFDKLLIRKKSLMNNKGMFSLESELSDISATSNVTYNLNYIWRYIKPNKKIFLTRDEFGNIYPIIIRIRILDEVFDICNITMDKINMESIYLTISEENNIKIPLLIRTDVMDNNSFFISISSRIYISNKTSNILRFLPNFKNVEQLLNSDYFIPPINDNPISIPKYNNIYYETTSRKYIDRSYIMDTLDSEIKKKGDMYDYVNVFINLNNINKNISIDMFTLYLNPNTYTCMPLWTCVPVLNAINKKKETKYYPLKVVLNNIWLETLNNNISKSYNVKVEQDNAVSQKELIIKEILSYGKSLSNQYKRVYIDLINLSRIITPLRSYKSLLSQKTVKRSKNTFESITIQLKKKVINNNELNSNIVSLCSSICDYTLNNSKGLFPLYVIKFEVPLIITNNLLIPIQISFNKDKHKVSSSLEKIATEVEFNSSKSSFEKGSERRKSNNIYCKGFNGVCEIEQNINENTQDGEKTKKSENDNLTQILEQVMQINDQNKSYIRVNNNERVLIESFPNSMNLSLLEVSFNKFFGFYKSSQIPIYYNSSRKEIDKELVVPLKFYNGYKLLPTNQIERINSLSTVLVNEFLPSSTCINLTFEKNRTSFISKDFIPRQKQDYNYYMDNLLNIGSSIDNLDKAENLDRYTIPTPWNGYVCHKYNTCKIRITIHASLWINNRQNIPIYILQNSSLASRYRLGSNEFRILPTSNGKTDISIALTPEMSKKCHSPFFHIERPNVIGTITVPSKRSSNLMNIGSGMSNTDLINSKEQSGKKNVSQTGLFEGLFSTNIGLKLSYCVTTINNSSNLPNFMINLYNKYTIVNYHNLPFWIREYKKMGHWIYIPPNISIPFHPPTNKDTSEVEITFLNPKVVLEYKSKYNINLKNIVQYKTLPLSIDKLCDIQIRLVSSIDNIPDKNDDNINCDSEYESKIGNLHFNYILSSISIYSINSSTSYQINVYPSQIPDFSIVNETPCNIFIKQLDTELWNNINPLSDSNYALVDPFGDHILEIVIGVNSNNIENSKSIKNKKHAYHYKTENSHNAESLLYHDHHKIPNYLYGEYKINAWYKTKNYFNLNKVLSHSKLFIPEHKKIIYFVILIENGTRVINISFDNTLYKRRRNEIRNNYTNLVKSKNNDLIINEVNNVAFDNTSVNSGDDNNYLDYSNNASTKSFMKTIGNKLKNTKKNKLKSRIDLNTYDDVEFDYDIYENSVIDYEIGKNITENISIKSLGNSEIGIQKSEFNSNLYSDTLHKNSFVSSFETDLSQMSNSNLSRASSGQNIFLLVDKIRPVTKISFELRINCDGFGISFLSNSNKEITYMSFQKINAVIGKSLYNLDQFHVRFRIMEFQLDNHITSSAENTIIRKATPSEFLRLSKLKSEKKKSYYSQLIKKTSDFYYGNNNVNDSKNIGNFVDDLENSLDVENYYGMESLFSVGVLTLGEGTKKKTEIIRIYNKLLDYMKLGFEISNESKIKEQCVKDILCMDSFLDIQFSIILDNNNGISNKYGSNGVVEMPYLYFWMYPLSIHLDIDTLREMVSILDLLINRTLSPTEELETTKAEIQALPLIENLKSASKYVYIQVLLMNPIQILCSTSKSTWNVSTNKNSNYIDCYNIVTNTIKMKENEVIIKEITNDSGNKDYLNKSDYINYRIVGQFADPYFNLNAGELLANQKKNKGNFDSFENNKDSILFKINENVIDINNNSNSACENDGNGNDSNNKDKELSSDQIQSNLTLNKTGTELILNILQWLSTMPFSNVPIEFKGVVNESIFMDSEKCINQVGDLYRQQIYSHIGKILGSIDLLGNPIDIYILLKEGLLSSKYHFDLFKRANKLKERISKNMERKIIQNKDDENNRTNKIESGICSYANKKSNDTSILDFDGYISVSKSQIDEEVDKFLTENKSIVIKYNAELMSKIVLFSVKEIFFGLQILLGTWIAVISQFVARMTSTAIHLLEVTYLLDQDCLMSYWYGTPLYVNRYLADHPKNLIDGLYKGFLRSFLILLSVLINFWNIPMKMKRQYGLKGVLLGVIMSLIRIVPAGFAAFISIFYGISSGIVESLRTKIDTKHIRKLRIVYNDSPILPYDPNQSIANITLSSLKLLGNLKESTVLTYIPFQTMDSNIDSIIINRDDKLMDDAIGKKFLIYNLLANNDDTSIRKYNGLIILKDSISLLKSGKVMWMIPIIDITRINLYLVINKVNSEEKSKKINIKNIFNNNNNVKNRTDVNLIDAKSHIFDIIKEDVHNNVINDYNHKKTFEFHLFVKPYNATQTNRTARNRLGLFFNSGADNCVNQARAKGANQDKVSNFNRSGKIVNLFSNKKYIRQFLLPKKIDDISINRRFVIDHNKMNIKTNNKTLNYIFNRECTNDSDFGSLDNGKSRSVIDTYSKRSSIISFSSSLSSQFPMSSYKVFTEKITFTVQSECDALNVFSLLSKLVNSE